MELIDYVKMAWNYKWIILLIVGITVSTTGAFTFLIPPTYTATAKLQAGEVRTVSFIPGYTSSNPKQEVGLSSYYIELANDAYFKKDVLNYAKKSRKKTDKVKLDSFQIYAQFAERTNLLELTVEARDPKLAESLANVAAQVLINKSSQLELGGSRLVRERVKRIVRSIDGRLAELRRASENLNAQSAPETEKTLKIASLQDEIRAAESLRVNKSNQLELDRPNNIDRGKVKKEIQSIDEQLAKLRTDLQNLKASPVSISETERTLKIASLQDEIRAAESLRVKKSNQLELYRPNNIDRGKVKKEMQSIDEQLAKLRKEYEDLKAQPASEREKAIKIEALKDEIAAAANSRQIYTDFLAKLALSEELQKGILQSAYPASVPSAPSSPNLFNNLLISSLVGLLLGLGVALVLSQKQILPQADKNNFARDSRYRKSGIEPLSRQVGYENE